MLRLCLRRLASAVPIMAIVATLTFLLVQLVPGDPASFLLGTGATADEVASLRASLGLDRPKLVQYGDWIGGLFQGDLGVSLVSNQTVADALGSALPVTVSVALLATVFTLLVGVTLGTVAAVRGGVVDRAVMWGASIGMAVPSFWLAGVLVLAFAIRLPVLPATGYVAFTTSPGEWLSHLVLPMVAVGLAGMGPVAFQTRAGVVDQLSRDYVRTLTANGLSRRRIVFRHVLRNASGPVVTVLSLGFVFALGGVMVIEAIFNLPGVGTLMLSSIRQQDLPIVQGAVLAFSLIIVAVNLLTDVVAAALNPRIRFS
ncbi:ABC transporter permease [Streptomyces sp. NEAU-YJ-81]|uniref:ABC transporter permease n=1 Tax=Streptomyces sp. NEAU-YJ-81 TaxID=2820288 RepID=UPI001ABC7103|nr:ABC transporter permease [Streptomyces sp. NEAU-YJ-81]MBO3682264.1 ABC transporter permease [Streptomyces sp. NEAU-YJ-81]